MLAAHKDQENRIHGQQIAAAAKPQNQGIKGLGSKTLNHKVPNTPLKVPLNDENATFNPAGKSVFKAEGSKVKQNGQSVIKGGHTSKNAFLTPAGPQRRAPLGMKTTNAKAVQTPGALTVNNHGDKTLQKTVSPRLRRPKVKVHQPEPINEALDVVQVPEVEYCPPKEIPLPDHPSDSEDEYHWGPDKKFPMFEGDNATRGWANIYLNPVMNNGETYLQQKERKNAEAAEADLVAMENKIMEDHWRETEARLAEEFDDLPFKKASLPPPNEPDGLAVTSSAAHRSPKKKSFLSSTLSSRAAMTALAAPKKSPASRSPDPEKPQRGQTASQARKPLPLGRKTAQMPAKPVGRHAMASAAAHSTLGYSKGRAAVSRLHGRANIDKENAPAPAQLRKKLDGDIKLPSALEQLGLGDEDDDLFGVYTPMADEDEDGEVFQLTLGV